jgi:DNA-binding XRE family transcriptional regulator
MDTRPQDRWEIRKRFLALRQKARFSQRKLGRIISLCRQSISAVENGHTVPRASTWARFHELEQKHNRPPIEFPTHWD